MTKPTYHIIFRACDVVNAVNNNPRPFDLDKASLIKVCFRSLYDSVQAVPHKIYVLGDKLSDSMMDFFSGYNVELSNGSYGNDESIRQTIKKALQLPQDDWVYFCEDDYLHRKETFEYINNFILQREQAMEYKARLHSLASLIDVGSKDLVIHPCDYPDRYLGKYRRQSFIFHSSDCHWRQITDTTFTFLMKGSSVHKYKRILEKSSVGANDRYLSKTLYGKVLIGNRALCVSPMPGLTSHMHRDTMSPIIDWKSIVDTYLD